MKWFSVYSSRINCMFSFFGLLICARTSPPQQNAFSRSLLIITSDLVSCHFTNVGVISLFKNIYNIIHSILLKPIYLHKFTFVFDTHFTMSGLRAFKDFGRFKVMTPALLNSANVTGSPAVEENMMLDDCRIGTTDHLDSNERNYEQKCMLC